MKRIVSALLLGLLPQILSAQPSAPEANSGKAQPVHTPEIFAHAVVAAADDDAVRAGVAILRAGGNALDAAAAVQFVLGLTEPQSSGLGGGAVLLYYDAKSAKVFAYDGRETAPAAAHPDRFEAFNDNGRAKAIAMKSGLAVGVPGALRALELARKNHPAKSVLPWSQLMDSAKQLATDGFAPSTRLQALLANEKTKKWARVAGLFESPSAAAYFGAIGGPDGRLKNPAYAQLLTRIAQNGPDELYTGQTAQHIVAAVAKHKPSLGDLTLEDLKRYKALKREPICGSYRQHKVCGFPMPSAGGTLTLQILRIFEVLTPEQKLLDVPLTTIGAAMLAANALNSLPFVRLLAETMRRAFADRAVFFGDPGQLPVLRGRKTGKLNAMEVESLQNALVAPEYVTKRAGEIGLAGVATQVSAGTLQNPDFAEIAFAWPGKSEEHGTSQICIVDADGNAVSMTTTIEDAFGSGLVVDGMLLNNQLTDFDFQPFGHVGDKDVLSANSVGGGKRPRTTMAPVVVLDKQGHFALVTGSPGGPTILAFVVKTLIGLLDFHFDAQQAIDAANFVGLDSPGLSLPLGVEKNTWLDSDIVRNTLIQMGYSPKQIVVLPILTSGLQVIRKTPQGYEAGSDNRRMGRPGGY